tara:strand:+ start:397 stop:621 length:225 start_codon:yes stop_codon:yes gene_type:complete
MTGEICGLNYGTKLAAHWEAKMIIDYKSLALKIQEAQPSRDAHLIAEWCLDIYPLSRYAVRQYVRRLIIEALRA